MKKLYLIHSCSIKYSDSELQWSNECQSGPILIQTECSRCILLPLGHCVPDDPNDPAPFVTVRIVHCQGTVAGATVEVVTRGGEQ